MYAAEIFSERINANILAILARKNEKEIEREGGLNVARIDAFGKLILSERLYD